VHGFEGHHQEGDHAQLQVQPAALTDAKIQDNHQQRAGDERGQKRGVFEGDDRKQPAARVQLGLGTTGTTRAQDGGQARQPAQGPQPERREVERVQERGDYVRCSDSTT
jgi:hypothetical protein